MEMGEVPSINKGEDLMIPNEVLEVNARIKEFNFFRSSLYKAGFYKEPILTEFVENVKNSPKLNSYISSYFIYTENPLEPVVRLTLRKAYFNRFGNDKYNTLAFYPIINGSMRNVFLKHAKEIIPMLEGNIKLFDAVVNSDRISLVYNIYKASDNMIIVEP